MVYSAIHIHTPIRWFVPGKGTAILETILPPSDCVHQHTLLTSNFGCQDHHCWCATMKHFSYFPFGRTKNTHIYIYIYVGMCMHLSRNMWFCTLNKCVHVHRTMHVSYMYSICMFRELHGYTSIDLRIYTYIYIYIRELL